MSTLQSAFIQAALRRPLVLDGGMGTSIMGFDLRVKEDFAGLENNSDILCVTRPDVVRQIHGRFFEAGCDAVETNTFNGNKVVFAEYDIVARVYEINKAAAQLAKSVAGEHSTADRPRFVVGSIGPGTKLASLRQIDFDRLHDSYSEQARGLLDGGVDALLIETCQDPLQIKAALNACLDVRADRGREDVPLLVQITMEAFGTMLVGTSLDAALTTIEAYPEVDVIGLNCATGPDMMAEHVRYLCETSTRLVSVLPNAGLPQLVNGRQHYALTADELARWHRRFVEEDGVNIIGGCCGTTYEHLAAVVRTCGGLRPKHRPLLHSDADRFAALSARGGLRGVDGLSGAGVGSGVEGAGVAPAANRCSSLYQSADFRQQNSFLIVGERCNTNGSKKFRELILGMDEDASKLDEIVQVALAQQAEGAHVLDVCVDYVGRDGVPDMARVASRLSQEVQLPLMLDSTQVDVLEAGLKLCPGKCIINSMNLEDGEEKLAKICGLARRYGAAVVALTIDEDPVEAMGKTAARKLEIARRIFDLAVHRYGIRPHDIMWDCLTFPITTGNEADRRLGLETLDGIQQVMREMPACQSVLGLSNISFGLKPAARKVLNSVYLDEARKRGLTAAIVHASGIVPTAQIDAEAYAVTLDLIYDRRGRAGTSRHAAEQGEEYDPLLVMSTLFDEAVEKAGAARVPATIEEKLKQRIIDGNKVGIDRDLAAAMEAGHKPLSIINDLLLDGMKVVGDLFGAGKMQLPFVLKSAECMKTAVAYLQPFMEKVDGGGKGSIVLATVKGDVHDIGKNLVDIILTNNGYTVHNIGIKQTLNQILEAWRSTHAQAIGMSGLLVKSTIIMKENLEEMNVLGVDVPVLLGGAALTRGYVEKDLRATYGGKVFYCKDAFEGLAMMDRIARGELSYGGDASVEAKVEARADAAGGVAVAGGGGGGGGGAVGFALRAAAALIADEQTSDEALEAAVTEQALGVSATSVAGVGMSDGGSAAGAGRGPFGRSGVSTEVPIPVPPFFGSRVVERLSLQAILGYINEVMLFQVQWQHKKARRDAADFKRYVDMNVRPIYRRLVETCAREQILEPKAIYGYWPCNSVGEDLVIFDPACASVEPENGQAGRIRLSSRREVARFRFPRQRNAPYWCLSDFFRPESSGEVDVVAFHVVTVGQRASDVAREWFEQNRYEDYLYLHGLGVECAEAMAEFIHRQVRVELGISGQDARRVQDLFRQGYQGSRYSFGYPACPRLEDHEILLPLLDAGRIGVELSDESQLHPEQSTTALICHHPEARYFNVR